jgi:hypothetical protein|tara:strand:+ start:1570 stop:2004 length:435 start_codon:yes stop_codon:yes gene_type:complete
LEKEVNMFQSRDEIRQVYLTVWKKMQQQSLLEPMEAIIADVIKLHPEYHALLDKDEFAKEQDFTPEDGQTNPFLHMGMHIAIREQANADRPPGIQPAYQKLLKKKAHHDAEHSMIECLGQALWQAQRDNTMPDDNAYLACVKKI